MYKEPQALTSVAKFMKAFNQPVLDVPAIPSTDRCELRVNLIQEELNELKDGIKAGDIVECADAFADLQYVLTGAIHEFGLGERFGNIFDNVHNSNMSKICNSYEEAAETLKHYTSQGIEVYSEKLEGDTYIIKRKEDNKVLKNLYYTPAKLTQFVKGENPTVEIISPFMQRLLFEADEVGFRIDGLTKFINIGMPGVSEFQRIVLPLQLQAMKTYSDIVRARIKEIKGS
jgi:predicted HAD superfamily Cof-like phosphohydrolase